MPALTRDEAQTRARLLEVHRYTIDLDLTGGDEHFGSTTVIRFTAREHGDTFVEVRPGTLRSVLLDGQPLDPAALTDGRYPLTGLTPGEHQLRIEADMRYSRTGEGMHRFTDPADGETYLYTMCCMTDGPSVFAAFDQPDLKAVFDVRVTAPTAWTVIGNGIARRTGDGHWHLAPTPPISTYLMAVAAGPYHSVHAEHAGLPLGLHVRRSLAEHLDHDAEELFDITRSCFDRFHEIFDEPYPFDSYDQAFVPEFNAGAMENPGLVTFREGFVHRSAVTDTERQTRAVVIAHEMAHMWFGDLVTMQWWDDIWLNESFAEYMGYQVTTEATRFRGAWTEFAVARKGWGYDADQRPSTHPVAPEPDGVPDTEAALVNFDGISYAKGASALRQLVARLGEKDFLAGINDHFARHRFANATLDDFLGSLARASGQDIHAWAGHWLRTTGADTLTPHVITSTADADAPTPHTWNLTVRHTGNRPHHVAVTAYDRAPADAGTLTLRERIELDVPADGDPDPRTLTGPRPDLLLVNDQDLTYAKIRLDPASWETVRLALSGLPDPLNRAVIWNAARDMVRDGELDPTAYLEAARAHLPHEDDIAVVEGVLAFARTQIADRYLAPEDRAEALAGLTAISGDLLRRTADGTAPGLRLAAARGLIDNSDQPDDIRSWLTHDTVPHGPRLDPELRWRILQRLAVLGATDTTELDAELARDPSATGREGAARCRAALPDTRAKADAWKAMFETDDLSNYLFTATAQGFWQPEQANLLKDYLPRYHAAAGAVSARRGAAIAAAAGRHAYPRHAVDRDTLRRTEECLRDDDLVPSLRRQLVDQLADLERALHVRGI